MNKSPISVLDFRVQCNIYIRFSNIITLPSKTRVIEYIGNDYVKKYSWKLKEYIQDGEPLPDVLKNNTMYGINGVLRRDVYKKNGEWIDKGAYIDFTGRFCCIETDLNFLAELKEKEGIL